MQQVKPATRRFTYLGKGVILGFVALLFLGWLLNTPAGLLGKADAVGYAVCHRIDSRSFHLGERGIPLCARCSGMYLGAMLGLIYQIWRYPRRAGLPPRKLSPVWGALVLAFGGDGLNSYFTLFPGFAGVYAPNNVLRLLTGTGMGLVIAVLVYPTFNQSVWAEVDRQPAIGHWVDVAVLLLAGGLLDALVLTENPLILYPLALISAAGVLVVLSMVYTVIWLMVIRRENHFTSIRELSFSLSVGFGLALSQIIILDVLRFALTGTWDGFHLG